MAEDPKKSSAAQNTIAIPAIPARGPNGNQRPSEAIRGNQSTSSASMEHSRAIKLGALSINRGAVPLPSAML